MKTTRAPLSWAVFLTVVMTMGGLLRVHGSEYAIELQHNPFNAPGLIVRARSDPEASEQPGWSGLLKGTLVSEAVSLANMDGKLVAIGETYEGFTLISVEERSVTFVKEGKEYQFQVEDDSDEDDASR